jgi:SnoaL-like polyketide cyclase
MQSRQWGGARTIAADQHEALIRAYIDEVFNGHRVDALEKYWNDGLTSHWLGMETIRGLPAWRAAMEGFFAAFPDAAYALDDKGRYPEHDGAQVILEARAANLLCGQSGRAAYTTIEPFPQSNPFPGAPDREGRSWAAQEWDIISKQKQPERDHPDPKDRHHRCQKTTQHEQHTKR